MSNEAEVMNTGIEECRPTAHHWQTIIFLHGRGSTAREFMEELFESQASDGRTLQQIFKGTKWVFPTAPNLQASGFNNMEMSQWFDMWETENPHVREDEQQVSEQVSRINQIIAQEAKLVGHRNIFLAGISQGCAIGIHALLDQEHRLAGFIGLSSWLLQGSKLRAKAIASPLDIPVFLAHHERDHVINIKYGEELRDQLTNMGLEVSWRRYQDDKQENNHWLNEPQGVDDIVEFVYKNTSNDLSCLAHTTGVGAFKDLMKS